MDKFWFMFKYYYFKNIKAKGFIIFNIFTVLATALLLNIDLIIKAFNKTPEIKNLYIYDQVEIYDLLETNSKEILNELNFEITKTNDNDFKKLIKDSKDIVVKIDFSEQDYFNVNFYANEEISLTITSLISDFLTNIKIYQLSQEYNINDEQLNKLTSPIIANTILVNNETEDINDKIISDVAKSFIMGITGIIYSFVFIYTSMLSSTIINEKISKTTMLIMSSVSAAEHLWAKVLSIFSLQMTQMFLLLSYFIIGISAKLLLSPQLVIETQEFLAMDISGTGSSGQDLIIFVLSSSLFWYYVGNTLLFIILNTLLILIISAIFSSIVSSMEDAGYVQLPIILIIIISYTGAMIFPNAGMILLTRICSYIPIVSVMFMPICIIANIATTTDILISLSTLIISLILVSKFCVPFYKRGTLNYSNSKISKQLKQVFFGENKIKRRKIND